MGEQAFEEMKAKEPIETDAATTEYVRCVADALTRKIDAQETRWEVVVFKDESANAFALPGGNIGVHTGLLRVAKTQDQLAAVLGHEIAHVTQQHANERVSQALLAEGGLSAASLALGGEGQGHDVLMAALGLGAQYGVLMPFSRSQESEADVLGLEYMARAGFDPRGAVELWQNMSAAAGGGAPPEFLSSHPSHESRIEELEEKLPAALQRYEAARAAGAAPRCARPRLAAGSSVR